MKFTLKVPASVSRETLSPKIFAFGLLFAKIFGARAPVRKRSGKPMWRRSDKKRVCGNE